MGDMVNSFVSGNNISSRYYLKNSPARKIVQNPEQNSAQKIEQLPQQEVVKKKKNGGYAKAISSSIIPGSGQLFDGRFGSAAVYFVAPVACFLGFVESAKSFFKNVPEFAINKLKHWFTEGIEKARQDIKFTEKQTFENLYKSAGAKCFKNGARAVLCGFALPVIYGMNIMDAYKGKRAKEISKSDNNSENKQKLSKSEKNMIGSVALLSTIGAGIAYVMNIRNGKTPNLSNLPAVLN